MRVIFNSQNTELKEVKAPATPKAILDAIANAKKNTPNFIKSLTIRLQESIANKKKASKRTLNK